MITASRDVPGTTDYISIGVPMPEHVPEAILKALAKKPEDRFSSVGEFVTELGRADYMSTSL